MLEALRLMIENEPEMSAGTLRERAKEWAEQPGYLLVAAEITVGGDCAIQHHGCTLLCDAVDTKVSLPDDVVTLLTENFSSIRDWRAQLGLCQMLSQPKAAARFDPKMVGAFSEPLTSSSNAFVRAWATTALVLAAHRDHSLLASAQEAVARCCQDPSKAVQARMRKIRLPEA